MRFPLSQRAAVYNSIAVFVATIAIQPTLGAATPGHRAARADVHAADTVRICLAPASIEENTGSTANLIDAVRVVFTSYLTGPTLGVQALTARLESQVREEAKGAGCPYLLFTTVKHIRKSGGGFLNRVVGGAVQAGAWQAGAATGSVAGQIAAQAAAGAAAAAAYDLSTFVKTTDELSVTYRLESASKPLVEKTEKRKARSDGEDLLSPLVQKAAEAIAVAVAKQPR